LESLRTFLDQGWVGTVIATVGTLVGLVGIIAAWWTYRASQIGARPVYKVRSLRLIGVPNSKLAQDVQVKFRGTPVDRLTKTQIVFWNSGNLILRGSDIVQSEPLRFDFPNGSTVVDVGISRYSRAANNCTAGIDPLRPNSVLFLFDYLDPNDGVVIAILHTSSVKKSAGFGGHKRRS
jgi:hypothetical protein